MSMIRVGLIGVFVLHFVIALKAKENEALSNFCFPENVTFGMNINELKSLRPSVKIRNETGTIRNKFRTLQKKEIVFKAARAGNLITVKKWENVDSKVDVYFEASNRSTSLTFISSSYFDKKEIFSDASNINKQKAIRDKHKLGNKNSGNEKELEFIDRLGPDGDLDK